MTVQQVRSRVVAAGFALVAAALPLAAFTSSPSDVVDKADCPIGWYWDGYQCVNAPNPVVGPVGPAGVGGLGPVAGPAGPVGVGGVGPVLGPAGPVGVGPR